MAKQRIINTRFWDDTYISNLDPIEKLLFLYFLTNPTTNICGVYELPIKNIALDTGLDKEMVLKIVDRFTRDRKIFYIEGWVYVKNFTKHQSTTSEKVQTGIKLELGRLPQKIKDCIDQIDKSDDADIPYPYPIIYPNLNSNLNPNTLRESRGEVEKPKKAKKPKREPKPIVWEEYLTSMDDSPQEHIQLIAYFFRKRGLTFGTDLEVESAIGRHAKDASEVVHFDKTKVFAAIDRCEAMWRKDRIRYTLGTVLKELTK